LKASSAEEPPREGRWSAAARLGAISAALTPPTIILHELGHFIVPLAFNRSARLYPTHVSGGMLPSDPLWMQAAQSGGGPLVTLIMAVAGNIVYRRTGNLWVLALTIAAVSRWLTSPIYLGMRGLFAAMGRPFRGSPNFDEFSLARILGLNGSWAAVAVTVILIATLWLLFSVVPRGRRWLYAASGALGVIGMNLAMHAVGGVMIAAT
jgi:hypothetical protein